MASNLKLRSIIAYGFGAIPENVSVIAFKSVVPPFFNIVLGLNPAAVSLLLSLPRLWDALTDPLMGWVSDNTSSRYGRRVPYIVIGAIGSAVSYGLFWSIPAGAPSSYYLVHLFVGAVVFYTLQTIYSVSYIALGVELSQDYDDRSRIFAWRGAIAGLATVAVCWLWPLLQSGWLGDPLQSAVLVGWAMTGTFVLCGLLPIWAARTASSDPKINQPRVQFWESVRVCVTIRPMVILIACSVLLSVPTWLAGSLAIYVVTYYVMGGDVVKGAALAAALGTVNFAAAGVLSYFAGQMAVRIGKIPTFYVGIGMTMIGSALKWFLLQPGAYEYAFIYPIFVAGGMAVVNVITPAMIADITQFDLLRSGVKRTAMFSGVFSWLQKVAGSMALLASGLVLVGTGFNASRGAAQSEETLAMMRGLFSWMPFGIMIIAAAIFALYPLTRDKVLAIDRELAARPEVQ